MQITRTTNDRLNRFTITQTTAYNSVSKVHSFRNIGAVRLKQKKKEKYD